MSDEVLTEKAVRIRGLSTSDEFTDERGEPLFVLYLVRNEFAVVEQRVVRPRDGRGARRGFAVDKYALEWQVRGFRIALDERNVFRGERAAVRVVYDEPALVDTRTLCAVLELRHGRAVRKRQV